MQRSVSTLTSEMLSDQNLVVVSGEFGRYPSSIEHLIRQFLPTNRVLWVEITGMRTPKLNLYDLKRAIGKVKRLVKGAESVESSSRGIPPNIHLSSPVTLPFPSFSAVRHLNSSTLEYTIRRETAALGFEDFGVITTLPMTADSVLKVGAAWSLYYCPDEWSLWPGLDRDLIANWEAKLLSSVDGIVVTSEKLKGTKSLPTKPARIVNHGVDVDHFSKANRSSTKNRVCFFGLFDERIDQELLAYISKALPDVSFEIIGPVQCSIRSDLLGSNVIWTGHVPYQTLPGRLADSSVLILPYVKNELTDNINPLKVKECLATGKPVVATAIAELKNMSHVYIANDQEEFIDQLKSAIAAKNYDNVSVIESMAAFSWKQKAAELSSILSEIMAKKLAVNG